MKRAYILITCIYFTQTVFAQKHFEVTIKLDSSIVPQKMTYNYDDGQKTVALTDSAKTRKIVLKGDYFSIMASLNVSYIDKAGTWYYTTFFISDKPAQIDLCYKPNINQLLLHTLLVNARDINDTTTNHINREMIHYNRDQYMANYRFYQNNKVQLGSNDSLRKVYQQMIRSVHLRAMDFLKKYPDDYYSFWYFEHNISTVKESKPDTAYLKLQLAYLKSAFPKKFTQSFEGRQLIKHYERAIAPQQLTINAPPFTLKTIDGKTIKLADLTGKIVLIDFWATWCAPCMAEIPFIKSIRDRYPQDKLVIIGISRDNELGKLKKVVNDQAMNWYHFFDNKTDICLLYGIDTFPTLILLNKEGKIIYRSDYIKDDTKELEKVLNKNI